MDILSNVALLAAGVQEDIVIENLLVVSPWFALAAGLVLYALDIFLTLSERYQYHAGAKDVLEFRERYTLRRPFQPGGGVRQFWDMRFALFLAGGAGGILLTWWVFTRKNDLPQVFIFAVGGLLLYEIAECIRLTRSVTLLRLAREHKGLEGSLKIDSWVTGNLYVIDLYGIALVALLAFLLSGSLFFLGGAVSSFVFGHQVRDHTSVQQIFGNRLKNRGK
jgi:hypothetical protein